MPSHFLSGGPMRLIVCAALCTVVAALAGPSSIAAQSVPESVVRGVVRDSASGVAVAGAVVMLLDANGEVLQRVISNEEGRYRLLRPDLARQARALRIGFRPQTLVLPDRPRDASSGTGWDTQNLDISLTAVPRLLTPMAVTAARGCPVRRDRAEAFGLLDQTRAGLLATVVAREQAPAGIRMLRFERRLDLDGIEIETQEVEMDSLLRAATSFNAAKSAVDFVERGFRTGENGSYTYYGPDADVLLDERFQRGYCFSVAESDSSHAGQVGLRFVPAQKRRGKIDVDGTIWIDTSARTLRELEFRYVGLEGLEDAFGSGGRVRYHTMPNGVSFIQYWSLRLLGPSVTSSGSRSRQQYSIREIGGEVAEAHWRDGTKYYARLGIAHVTAVTSSGEPARFTRLRMADTDYRVTTDATGRATFTDLVPGPYRLVVEDPELSTVSLFIPTSRQLVVRGASSALVRVVVPSLAEYVSSLCGADTMPGAAALLLMRFAGTHNEPLSKVSYTLGQTNEGQRRPLNIATLAPPGGVVARCTSLERRGMVDIAAWREERNVPREVVRLTQPLDNDVTVMLVSLPTAKAAGANDGSERIVVTGTVRDSAQQRAVTDARVTFVGTKLEGATDYSGTFVVGGIRPGEYQVDVSTPWLDSIGAYARSTVTVADNRPLTLYTPMLDVLLRDACRASPDDAPDGAAAFASNAGAVVGRVNINGAKGALTGVRVVARWSAIPRRNIDAGSVRTTLDADGQYRLCGVPTDADLELQAVDTVADLVSASGSVVTARIPLVRRFARVDLVLDVATPERDLVCVAGVDQETPSMPTDSCISRPLLFNLLSRSR